MRALFKWPLFMLLTFALVGASGYLLYRSQRSADEGAVPESRVPVTALPVTAQPFSMRAEYSARLEGVREVTVTARVGGTVEEDLVSEGDPVKVDQPLYRIEEAQYLYTMEQAEAALDLARENLEKVRDISRPEMLRRLEALLGERRAALEKARNDARRMEELFRQGAVPLSQKESADLALAAAEASEKVALENFEEARSGARAEDRAAAEAAVRQAEASLKLARDTWEKTVIRAPVAGRVASKKIFLGDSVIPGTAVAEIVDLRSFRIEVGVSSEHVVHLSAGQEVTLTPIGTAASYLALVKDVGVKADERSGSFPVILEMANPGGAAEGILRAGMDVTVFFRTFHLDDAVVIPSAALVREVDQTAVFVVEEERARRRIVTLGPEDGGRAVVLENLSPGDLLVTVGQQRLREGDLVETTFE